jgi:ABC-type multidrug transport system permease subunit
MIGAAIHKDIALLARDRGALVSMFVLPIIFMCVFGAVFQPQRSPPSRIAVAADTRIVVALTSAGFSPRVDADVRGAVANGRADAGVIVTAEAIELVIDRGMPLQMRGPLEAALQAVTIRALAPSTLPRVVVTSAGREAAEISGFQLAVPGNAVLFCFFLSLTVAMAFAGERRTGTWHRLLAAPVPRWQALAAMLVPYFVIGLVQLAFLFTVAALAFDLQIAGSLAALIALSVATVYCAVALGLTFAAFSRSERGVGSAGAVVLLVMGMIGGCMIPRVVMPKLMQTLGLAVPHGWALDGFHAVLVRPATSLVDVAPALGALTLFGTAFVVIGLARFRFV